MVNKRAILRKSIPEIIADDVRERILTGELAEGETIRQESLAEEYEVSRMPVREALKRLDSEGLVQLTNNKGATVISHSLHEIGEIFDLRMLVEVDMFRRAIPKMKKTDFAYCQELVDEMTASYEADDVAKWGELNMKYHMSLYAAADRELTKELLQKISLQSDRYVRIHLIIKHRLGALENDHQELLNLAQKQDVEGACKLLADHISRARDELLAVIEESRKNNTKPLR